MYDIEYTKRLLLDALQIRTDIQKTNHLFKLFDNKWFLDLEQQIKSRELGKPFHSPEFAFFIWSKNDHLFGREKRLLDVLDENLGKILSRPDVSLKRIKGKLTSFKSQNFSNYFGFAFELIILGECINQKTLKKYEPPLPNGRYADGLIRLNNEEILMEISSIFPEENFTGGCPRSYMAKRISESLERKADQIGNTKMPSILFFLIPIEKFVWPEYNDGFKDFLSRKPSDRISVILFSIMLYPLENFIFINPSASFPITNQSLADLRKIFNPKTFVIDDIHAFH